MHFSSSAAGVPAVTFCSPESDEAGFWAGEDSTSRVGAGVSLGDDVSGVSVGFVLSSSFAFFFSSSVFSVLTLFVVSSAFTALFSSMFTVSATTSVADDDDGDCGGCCGGVAIVGSDFSSAVLAADAGSADCFCASGFAMVTSGGESVGALACVFGVPGALFCANLGLTVAGERWPGTAVADDGESLGTCFFWPIEGFESDRECLTVGIRRMCPCPCCPCCPWSMRGLDLCCPCCWAVFPGCMGLP